MGEDHLAETLIDEYQIVMEEDHLVKPMKGEHQTVMGEDHLAELMKGHEYQRVMGEDQTVMGYPLNHKKLHPTYLKNQVKTPTHDDPSSKKDTTLLECYCLIALIILFIIFGTTMVVYDVYHPNSPYFQVESVSVSPLNSSSTQSVATWNISFHVRNPKEFDSVSYPKLETNLYYGNTRLSSGVIAPFSTFYNVDYTHVDTIMMNVNMKDMGMDVENLMGNFTVRVEGKLLKISHDVIRRVQDLTATCNQLEVGLPTNTTGGSLISGSRECQVGLKQWWYVDVPRK